MEHTFTMVNLKYKSFLQLWNNAAKLCICNFCLKLVIHTALMLDKVDGFVMKNMSYTVLDNFPNKYTNP